MILSPCDRDRSRLHFALETNVLCRWPFWVRRLDIQNSLNAETECYITGQAAGQLLADDSCVTRSEVSCLAKELLKRKTSRVFWFLRKSCINSAESHRLEKVSFGATRISTASWPILRLCCTGKFLWWTFPNCSCTSTRFNSVHSMDSMSNSVHLRNLHKQKTDLSHFLHMSGWYCAKVFWIIKAGNDNRQQS